MLNTAKKTDIKQGTDKHHRLSWLVIQEGREVLSFPLGDFYGASKTAHQYALEWVAREYSTPRKGRSPHDIDEFKALRPCWVFSPIGPCLGGYRFVRQNKKSVTVASLNGRSISIGRVHSVHFASNALSKITLPQLQWWRKLPQWLHGLSHKSRPA